MRELAVQASNTTLTDANRLALADEMTALTAEIDRIASTTQYNNNNLLDGSASALSFQIGDQADQNVGLSISSSKSADLGLSGAGASSSTGLIVGGKVDGTTTTLEYDDILINGETWGANANALTSANYVDPVTGAQKALSYTMGTAYGAAQIINTNSDAHGVTASAITALSRDSVTGVSTGAALAGDSEITLTGAETQTLDIGQTSNMAELAAALTAADEHITATVNARGGIDYLDTLGRTITLDNSAATLAAFGFAAAANTGHLVLNSVDGSSDIVISGNTDLFSQNEPFANTLATGVGERKDGAAALGLNYGSYSYNGGTTVETSQISSTLMANTDTLTINGVKLGATTVDISAATYLAASDFAAVFNAVSAESGVTATAKNEVTFAINMLDASLTNSVDTEGPDILTFNGVTTTLGSQMSLTALVASLNNDHLNTSTGLVFAESGGSNIVVTSASGATIEATDAGSNSMITAAIHHDGTALDRNASILTPAASEVYAFRGYLELSNANGDVVLGTTATNDDSYAVAETLAANLGLELSKKDDTIAGSTGLDLSSATTASAAITSIDNALSAVNTIRGGLGAMANRLEHTVSNLTTTIENHSASRSRIMDADFAAESAALSKAQVLAQASTAMLAQANAVPQLALQLLQ
jgi:flagellin